MLTLTPLFLMLLGCDPGLSVEQGQSAGCSAGTQDGQELGASDGAACTDASDYPVDYGERAGAECEGQAAAKNDKADPCVNAWMAEYRSCFDAAYATAYDAAALEAGCA